MIELNPETTVDEIYRKKINAISRAISNIEAKISSKFHIWWAKKPGNVIEQLILSFTQPNDIVLDPFSGSGTVLEETIKLNRKSLAIDINPLSIFIMKNLITNKNWNYIEKKFNFIMDSLEKDSIYPGFKNIFDFYKSNCPKCNQIGNMHYIVWQNDSPFLIRLECATHGVLTKNKIDCTSKDKEVLVKKGKRTSQF